MDLDLANEITGGLSFPSKIPGPGYSIPAKNCVTGSKLREVKNSVCSSCYARRGNYLYTAPLQAMQRRLKSLDHPQWVDAMVTLIQRYAIASGYFRWHDSGDLQSREHFQKICMVARRTPEIRHWLPTKEYAFVKGIKVPDNLVVRQSAHLKDKMPPTNKPGSMVSTTGEFPKGVIECEAYKRGNFCGPCRACWDPKVKVIGYHAH